MKILALASLSDAPDWRKDNTTSPVDQWRIVRPYMALKKYAGWEVDFDRVVIPNFERGMEITDQTFTDVHNRLKNYDAVVTSYFTNGAMYSLLAVMCEKLKIPLLLDFDDDWIDLPDDNPVWTKISKKEWGNIMVMIEDAPYITTTNEYLAEKFRKLRQKDNVLELPNMISTEDYRHEPYDNGDKVVIGWFGGASHYKDFHDTGILPALERIMHEYKQVELHICGMVTDHYLPAARTKRFEPQRGFKWLELYRQFKFDIGLAPLTAREFDQGKSDIKWQEYALMGAAFAGTNTGPYERTVKNELDGLLTANSPELWYNTLRKLVLDKPLRKALASRARDRVISDYSIENNWHKVKEVVEYAREDIRRHNNI